MLVKNIIVPWLGFLMKILVSKTSLRTVHHFTKSLVACSINVSWSSLPRFFLFLTSSADYFSLRLWSVRIHAQKHLRYRHFEACVMRACASGRASLYVPNLAWVSCGPNQFRLYALFFTCMSRCHMQIKHFAQELYGPWERSRYSDLLRAGRSGVRIPVGARFSAPVQTGPGAHPVFCTVGTGSFSTG
jgi:hypothetical protein